MKAYRHDLKLFAVVPGVIGMVLYSAIQLWRFEGPLRGGEAMRYGFAAFALLFAVGVTYLFLRFAVVRYHLTEEGLMVRGPFGTRVRAWEELQAPRYHRFLKSFSMRDTAGTLVIFSSVDYFSDVGEFFETLQARAKGGLPKE